MPSMRRRSWSRSSPGSSLPGPSPPSACCGPRTTAAGSPSGAPRPSPCDRRRPRRGRLQPRRRPRVSRRGSGQPVTIAFGGDVHFEGMLRPQARREPAGVLAPIAPVLVVGRPRGGEPRDRDHRAAARPRRRSSRSGRRRRALTALAAGRRRRREHGQQPRPRLRPRRPRRLARGVGAHAVPGHRHRPQRGRGVRALPRPRSRASASR